MQDTMTRQLNVHDRCEHSILHVQWIRDCCGIQESAARASHKCYSRVRHFGRVFDSPVQSGCMLRATCAASMTLHWDLPHAHLSYNRMTRVRAPSVRIPTSSTSSALTEWKRRCALQRSSQARPARVPADACSHAACSRPLHLLLSWLA